MASAGRFSPFGPLGISVKPYGVVIWAILYAKAGITCHTIRFSSRRVMRLTGRKKSFEHIIRNSHTLARPDFIQYFAKFIFSHISPYALR